MISQKRLEGLPRHTSMHAAGVVISQRAVDEYVPLSRGSDGAVVTQYTMTALEELGPFFKKWEFFWDLGRLQLYKMQ